MHGRSTQLCVHAVQHAAAAQRLFHHIHTNHTPLSMFLVVTKLPIQQGAHRPHASHNRLSTCTGSGAGGRRPRSHTHSLTYTDTHGQADTRRTCCAPSAQGRETDRVTQLHACREVPQGECQVVPTQPLYAAQRRTMHDAACNICIPHPTPAAMRSLHDTFGRVPQHTAIVPTLGETTLGES